jgi:riboflavin kinase/FMN adenylyltransferase
MKIYRDPGSFQRLHYAVVTSGTFDGVHLGHQKILNRLKEVAEKNNGETVLLTYWPHPRLVLNPEDDSVRLLNTFSEKAELLEKAGIDHLICIPFTRSFSEMRSADFIRDILVEKIGTRKLVIGYDHHFGKNREGNLMQLISVGPEYGFEVEEIPRQDIDDAAVSSSAIRKFLSEGAVKKAAQLLGRPYDLTGKVISGDQLGRQIGFPTANLSITETGDSDSKHKIIPAEGIYAVSVTIGDSLFGGMLYIGQRPTVGGTAQVIEVNIFDFDRQIYGETVQVQFLELIRGDQKFDSLELLKNQLFEDRRETLKILKTETR